MKLLVPTDRTCLVTHRGCLDGTGSALMFIWAGGKRENVVFRNPTGCVMRRDELPSDVDEVWYADCCPNDFADPTGGLPFLVFDHHVSNQRLHGEDPRCTFDMTKSGTSLMASILGVGDRPGSQFRVDDLIAALEAYDLGRFDDVRGQFLADLAATYSQDDMLDELLSAGPDIFYFGEYTARADAIASVRRLYVESALRGVMYKTISWPGMPMSSGDVDVGVAVSPVYWKNDLAAGILNSGKAEVAIIIDPTGQMVSLRSHPGGPDCSMIAAAYGGGGHARAAGFKGNGQYMLESLMNEVLG